MGGDGETHTVSAVDIDTEGNLTETHNIRYLTDSELSCRGINLTKIQWMGIVKHLIKTKYSALHSAIDTIPEDLVNFLMSLRREIMVEELPRYLNLKLNEK